MGGVPWWQRRNQNKENRENVTQVWNNKTAQNNSKDKGASKIEAKVDGEVWRSKDDAGAPQKQSCIIATTSTPPKTEVESERTRDAGLPTSLEPSWFLQLAELPDGALEAYAKKVAKLLADRGHNIQTLCDRIAVVSELD